jgi:cytochrome c biogenesis protein CcmG/thiol:disulfide interchange protein DsbE
MHVKALRLAAWAIVAASVAMALIFAGRFGSDPGLAPSPLLGRQAPAVKIDLLDGSGTFDVAAHRGETLIINFFASWCLPCRQEQVQLTAAADAFFDRGVRLVGISYNDRPERAIAFLNELGFSPTAIYAHDAGGLAAIAFGVYGVPETFFVDARGTVAAKIIGPMDALVIGNTIESVLAGQSPGQVVVGRTYTGPGG